MQSQNIRETKASINKCNTVLFPILFNADTINVLNY